MVAKRAKTSTPRKPANRGGRPTKAQQLQRLIETSPELSKGDVRRLLGRLAVADDTPAHVRAQVLRTLLGGDGVREEAEAEEKHEIVWYKDAPQ